MLETKSALSRPLVMSHGRDGRCRYDPIAKQELVQSCLLTSDGNSGVQSVKPHLVVEYKIAA